MYQRCTLVNPGVVRSEVFHALCHGYLSSDQWIKIHNAAAKQWPTETLSRAEIVRRYTVFGIQVLKNTSADDQTRLSHQFQASMEASDTRLKHQYWSSNSSEHSFGSSPRSRQQRCCQYANALMLTLEASSIAPPPTNPRRYPRSRKTIPDLILTSAEKTEVNRQSNFIRPKRETLNSGQIRLKTSLQAVRRRRWQFGEAVTAWRICPARRGSVS